MALFTGYTTYINFTKLATNFRTTDVTAFIKKITFDTFCSGDSLIHYIFLPEKVPLIIEILLLNILKSRLTLATRKDHAAVMSVL